MRVVIGRAWRPKSFAHRHSPPHHEQIEYIFHSGEAKAGDEAEFHSVCLITALRKLGVPMPITCSGPFRALGDGNLMLHQFNKVHQ